MDRIMVSEANRLSGFMVMLPRIEALKPIGQQRRIGPRPARGKTYYPNGAREIARRTRQIECGQFKIENGYRPGKYILFTGDLL